MPKTGCLSWPMSCAILMVLCLGNPCGLGQDSPGVQDSLEAIDRSVDALKKIQKDYAEFLAKRKRIHEDYSKMEETLRKTEEDFQRINNDAMRQQIMAMQSSLQSSRIFETLADLPNSVQQIRSTSQGSSQAARRNAIRYENNLVRAKAMADLDVAIRGVQLNQLDAASQATVRRRLETFQSGMKLQNEWIQWQSDWPKFLDRYWPHSDPERRFTKSELEARLEVLKDSDPEDFAAMIVKAWLYERLGRWDEALEVIEQVIAAETYFESTALCTKAFILYELGKEKDAKATLQSALKVDTKSPFDRWIRARISASRKQFPEAEKEWKVLTTLKDFELEARRSLALVGYARASRSAPDAKKSLKEAQLAYDLEPTHDWFSHVVLGLAMHAAKKEPDALKQFDKAEEKATDENLELCKRIREAIVDGQTFEWNFQDGYGDRKPD
ncbi:MAG: tetratricopeptide repeat protein [Pirellula sp.]|jgi:tetratricopeptide (TPR) repeat protein